MALFMASTSKELSIDTSILLYPSIFTLVPIYEIPIDVLSLSYKIRIWDLHLLEYIYIVEFPLISCFPLTCFIVFMNVMFHRVQKNIFRLAAFFSIYNPQHFCIC